LLPIPVAVGLGLLTASFVGGKSSPHRTPATARKPVLHKPVRHTPVHGRPWWRTRPGLHGTGIVADGVIALPRGQVLSRNAVNTVVANTDLGFAVTVDDTGDSPEAQVKVTLTVLQYPSPIVRTKTIESIDPGRRRTVAFRNLGAVSFATRTTVKVDVSRVPGEKNTRNNSAAYPLIFSLG
jgi:hypothetical protein